MNKKKLLKAETQELVHQKIETALAGIAAGVKKKQFEKKLQKASSLLAKDIAKAAKQDASKKVETKKGKAGKKAAKKLKTKKAGKNTNTVAAKMNNVPVVVGEQVVPENIVP